MKLLQITILFSLSIILGSSNSLSQFKRYGGKKKPEKMSSFVQSMDYQGWYFAPGVTLTPKLNFFNYDPILSTSTSTSEEFTALNLQQQSKPGLYLEVGRYHLLSTKKLISYIDYGIAYKQLRAGQTYDLERIGLSSSDTTSYSQSFQSHAALAHFNANNVLAINKNIFFQNTLGVNVDYQFSQKLETTDNTSFVATYQDDPSKLWAQLHYKFGVGVRIGKQLYAIPSVEIPLLNGWQWEGGRSTFGAFNSRYRPVVFSIRFAWLTTPKCPRVWDNDDSTENGGGM